MFNTFIKFVLPILAIALIGFAIFHVLTSKVEEKNTTVTLKPPASDFDFTVAGAGIVEARNRNVAIGTPVPGIVKHVYVAVNQKEPVKKGDMLFEIDDSDLQAELVSRKAELFSSQANLVRLQSSPRREQVPVSQAALEEAKANLQGQTDLLARAEKLAEGPNRVLSEDELTQRRMAYNTALAIFHRTEAEFKLMMAGSWTYDIDIAKAAVNQAESQIKQLELRINRTKVRAPYDGNILQVNIRDGEYAGAMPNQTLIMLGDISVMNVRVDIDEIDIPRFQSGGNAYAMLKGAHTEKIPLKFEYREPYVIPKQSLTGLNTERVDTRVMQVIYSAAGSPVQLQVGQQVDVFINAAERGAGARD